MTPRPVVTALEVERRSIDQIPENERHGHPRSLFTLWFAANMQITSAVTGALTVLVGLHPLWALVAIAWATRSARCRWRCTRRRARGWASRR